MTEQEDGVCKLLAAYSKELNSTDEIAEKGRIQIKHAKIIIQARINLPISNIYNASNHCKQCSKPIAKRFRFCSGECKSYHES